MSALEEAWHPTLVFLPGESHGQIQSFPASGSFQMSQLFAPGGQSIRVSASTSVLSIVWVRGFKKEVGQASTLWPLQRHLLHWVGPRGDMLWGEPEAEQSEASSVWSFTSPSTYQDKEEGRESIWGLSIWPPSPHKRLLGGNNWVLGGWGQGTLA